MALIDTSQTSASQVASQITFVQFTFVAILMLLASLGCTIYATHQARTEKIRWLAIGWTIAAVVVGLTTLLWCYALIEGLTYGFH